MNEEEYNDCSVVAYPREIRFLHIKGKRISYYVDRHVSDYVNKIQQENQQLKGSLQTYEILLKVNIEENKQLKENYECILKQRDDLTKNATEQLESSVGIVKHNRAIQEHIDKERELQNQLQQKEDIINKANKKIEKMFEIGDENKVIDDLLEIQKILDNKGE